MNDEKLVETDGSSGSVWCDAAGISGLRREYGGLRVQPCIPGAWKELTLTRTFRGCRYHIHISNTGSGKPEVTVDGNRLADTLLPVLNDGQIHEVVVRT